MLTDHETDLAQYDYLNYAGPVDGDENTNLVSFRLFYLAYNSLREEIEYESNAASMLATVEQADDRASYVSVGRSKVTVTVRQPDGQFTAPYLALVEVHAQLADYPILDEDDVESRKSEAAVSWIWAHEDDAAEIIDGGQEKFDADEWCQSYAGCWCDYADLDRDEAVRELALRMAYVGIDEG